MQTKHIQVQKLLSAFDPPMDRFLEHFIDFGCRSQDFLCSISSWAPDKRHEIEEILRGDHGISETEISVIENKLETYLAVDGI